MKQTLLLHDENLLMVMAVMGTAMHRRSRRRSLRYQKTKPFVTNAMSELTPAQRTVHATRVSVASIYMLLLLYEGVNQ
jgi:hypothetical protein